MAPARSLHLRYVAMRAAAHAAHTEASLAAGLFSGLVSHVGRGCWQYPRMIARLRAAAKSEAHRSAASKSALAAAAAPGTTTTADAATATAAALKKAAEGTQSLGSSGAIYALLAITAFGFPDAEVALVIPPSFPLNIQTCFYGLCALDVLGVLRGWRCVSSLPATRPR